VKLAYTAGAEPQKFVETNQVLEGLPHDVKLLTTTAYIIVVDPDFAHTPEQLTLLKLRPKQKDQPIQQSQLINPAIEPTFRLSLIL